MQNYSYHCHHTSNQYKYHNDDECIVTRKSRSGVWGWNVGSCVVEMHFFLLNFRPYIVHHSALCTSADTSVTHSVGCCCCHSHWKATLGLLNPGKTHQHCYRESNSSHSLPRDLWSKSQYDCFKWPTANNQWMKFNFTTSKTFLS